MFHRIKLVRNHVKLEIRSFVINVNSGGFSLMPWSFYWSDGRSVLVLYLGITIVVLVSEYVANWPHIQRVAFTFVLVYHLPHRGRATR